MCHQKKNPAKKWDPPAQTGAPRETDSVASASECTGLTPIEPDDIEEAYALGRLYAIHTLRRKGKKATVEAPSQTPSGP